MLDAAVDATLVCRYNDLDSVREAVATHHDEIAAVVLEPIAHNSPSILPEDGFLAGLRDVCTELGVLLIFDEIITGFRHHLGGFQAICGVKPDLTCLGKAMANGFPVAAVAGSAHLLERFNTTANGDVTFAGTYNGGAAALAAASATIEELEQHDVHEHVFQLGDRMRDGLREMSRELGVPTVVSGLGSLYIMLFMEGPLRSYEDALRNDRDLFVAYRRELVRRGVFEMPENIGRSHISFSHTKEDVDQTLQVARDALVATLDKRSRRRSW
jgi:glutamate-1-semialdehyde 2,1-aminomutase